MGIQIGNVVNAVVYAALGIFVFRCGVSHHRQGNSLNLWKEIVQEHNTALAILIGTMSIGICIIIASAIH